MQPGSDADALRKGLILAAIVVGALLLWQIRGVLLAAFAAMLLAVLFHAIGSGIGRVLHLPYRFAFPLGVVAFAALLGLAIWLFSTQLAGSVADLLHRLPDALRTLADRIRETGWGRELFRTMGDIAIGDTVLAEAGNAALVIVNALGVMVLVVAGSLFLAASPDTYRQGLKRMFPVRRHRQAEDTIAAIGQALQRWLLGQLISMVVTGMLTALGLWLVGAPSPLAVALVVGIGEFVPFVGPFLGAVVGLVLASQEGWNMVLLVGIVFTIVQQVEGNLLMPLVQRQMVSVPPGLMVFAVVAFGILFGVPGFFLAAPLTVVAFVAVQKLYVSDLLNEEPSTDAVKKAERRK